MYIEISNPTSYLISVQAVPAVRKPLLCTSPS